MITPKDVRERFEEQGIQYGDNMEFSDDIDTSDCEEFFGTRCPENVHVKGKRKAHVDRVDPRKNPFGHLKRDVGVPYAVMTSAAGSALGAALSKDRKKGAAVGGLAGALLGAVLDVIDERHLSRSRHTSW